MQKRKLGLRRNPLLGASLLALTCFPAKAQTPTAEATRGQTVRVPARVVQAVDNTNRVTLRGNVHRLARPEFDKGAMSDAAQANRMVLILKRSAEQEASLLALLDQQQGKNSANYHVWLTPEQFGKQFGPADEDVQAVTLWLQGQGLQVKHLSAGRAFIEFTGTVGQVRNAFHTDIHRFLVNGQERFANVSDPQIPAALAPVVAGVTALHNFPRKALLHKAGVFQREGKKGEVRPFFTGGSGSNQFFALGPADFAKIYNVPPALDGTGQTIAVVGDSNIDINDVRAFRTFFGLPGNDPKIVLNGPDPGIDAGTNGNGDEGEADLDVEWSGAIAPAATIQLVIAENPNTFGASGVDLAALYVVENNLAPVMSESFGDCEPMSNGGGIGGNGFYASLWEQAAAQGITVMVSTGDSGSAACDGGSATATSASKGLTVSGIASTQFNVAVGGTDFDDIGKQSTFWKPSSGNDPVTLASALSYIPETPWNDSCAAAGSLTGCATVNANGVDLVAAGGGPSSVSPKPTWQTGTGVPADGKRDLPDISLFASDGTKTDSFYFLCQADAVDTPSESCATAGTVLFIGAGGTSASSPAFAAIMALINQQTGERQGNANYVLYKLAAQATASCNSSTLTTPQLSSNTCVFYDTTKGNISVACAAGSTNCSNTGSSGTGVLVDPSNKTTAAWATTAGYDRATGLGSVNVANLAAKWNTVTFNSATTTITSSPSGTIAHSSPASFTISVTGSGTPTGDVSLIAEPVGVNNFVLGADTLAAGSATITTNLLPGGTYPVFAHYGGSATFGGSDSAPVTVSVGTESSKTVLSFVTFDSSGNVASQNATTAAYGSPYILRVDVTNTAGNACSSSTAGIPCPTGIVTLKDNNAPLRDFSGSNNAPLGGQGFLEDQPIQLPVGSHALVAAYAGDSSYTPSTSSTDTVNITKATTTTAVMPSTSSVVSGASVTLTATVGTSSSGVAPTGTVVFLNGSTPISGTIKYKPTDGSASAPASLTATLTTTISALAPLSISERQQPNIPFGRLLLLACVTALLALYASRIPGANRRKYACATLMAFCALSIGLAGCGGGGGGSSTPAGKSVTIGANYSGDTNYSTSSGTATIAVQ